MARTWGSRGDAAEAFATLVERLEAGEDYRDVPGIVYRRDDGEVAVSEGRFVSDFHNFPRLDLLDMRRYNGSGFGVGVVTKLAQAYYPTLDSSFDGSDWRARPAGEVVEEIAALNRDFGINKVFFIDSGFNVPADAAKALCIAILESGLKIRWNSYVRPGSGDEELFGLMKRSGCSAGADVGVGQGFGGVVGAAERLGGDGASVREGGAAVYDECGVWGTRGDAGERGAEDRVPGERKVGVRGSAAGDAGSAEYGGGADRD